jgi:hypothetical protein
MGNSREDPEFPISGFQYEVARAASADLDPPSFLLKARLALGDGQSVELSQSSIRARRRIG